MSRIFENTRTLRATVLGLLVVAMLGPWAYDLIHVPAEYPCELPFVRLEGDFCGLSVSLLGGISMIVGSAVDNAFSEMASYLTPRNFYPLLLTLSFTLPFFTTLGLILRRESARLQVINLVVLVLAAVAGGWYLAMSRLRPHSAPWGVALYVVVALGILALELSLFKRSSGFRSTTLADNRDGNGK
jgi:hypothetical protein